MFRVFGLIVLLVISLPVVARAQTTTDVRLAWDASSDPAVSGYMVDYGTASGVYTQAINVGNVLTYTIQGLLFNKTYYFSVRAYDGSGAFSSRSNEVVFTTDAAPGGPPASCTLTFSATTQTLDAAGGTGTVRLSTQTGCTWNIGSNMAWLSVGNPTTVSSATVNYTAAPNFSKQPRQAIVYSGNRSVTVTQRGKMKADFNRDGRNDLIWQNRQTGELSVWSMNGTDIIRGEYFSPANVGNADWKVMASLDADRDGQTDLLLQHDAGYVAIWRMSGKTRVQALTLSDSMSADPRWRIVGTGDMDGDGYEDILWQHTDGRVLCWYMNGLEKRDEFVIAVVSDARWRVAAIEDFNNDDKPDILWRHTSWGQFLVWNMNNRQFLSAGMYLIMPNEYWQVAAVGDYSGDGRPDLIWRNTVTGELAAWILDGDNVASSVALTPGSIGDLNWHLAGPR
jgi:hypothetical protein